MRATQRGDGAWQRSSLRLGQCQYRLHSGKHGHRTTVACKEDLVGAPTRRWATLSVVRQLLLDALRRRTATNSLGGAIEDLRLVCARPQFQIVEPSPVDARSLDLRSHSKPVFGMGYDATLAPSLDKLSREADLVKEAHRETHYGDRPPLHNTFTGGRPPGR